MTIYVVYGSTGEYSDHREWWVRAFTNETKAADLVQRLTAAAACFKYGYDYEKRQAARAVMAAVGDPGFDLDYTGTLYAYATVELDSE